jgi:hypothetical protein
VGKTCLYKTGLRKQGWEHRAEKTGLEKQVLKRGLGKQGWEHRAGKGWEHRAGLEQQGWAGKRGRAGEIGWENRAGNGPTENRAAITGLGKRL